MSSPIDKFRAKVGQASPGDREEGDEPELVPADDATTYTAFRAAPKLRRIMIRTRSENHHAPAYSQLIDIMFDGAVGKKVGLIFTHMTVRLLGHNLQDLARQIAGEKVQFVQEYDSKRWATRPAENEPVIESIVLLTKLTDPFATEGKHVAKPDSG